MTKVEVGVSLLECSIESLLKRENPAEERFVGYAESEGILRGPVTFHTGKHVATKSEVHRCTK